MSSFICRETFEFITGWGRILIPVLRRIVQKKDRKQFYHCHGVSYSTLRQEFRELLGPFVVDIKKFGLHGMKSSGASNLALRGVTLNYLIDMLIGRAPRLSIEMWSIDANSCNSCIAIKQIWMQFSGTFSDFKQTFKQWVGYMFPPK